MSSEQARRDAEAREMELEQRVRDLENIVAQWQVNGAEDLFSVAGGHTFGAGAVRLDRNGMKFRTNFAQALAPAISWQEEFWATAEGFNAEPGAYVRGTVPSGTRGLLTLLASEDMTVGDSEDIAQLQLSAEDNETYIVGSLRNDANVVKRFEAKFNTIENAFYLDGLTLGLWSDTSDPANSGEGEIWYRSDLKEIRLDTGSGGIVSIGAGGGGGMQVLAVKATDTTRSSTTTLTADPHLSYAIGANENWVYEFSWVVDSAAAPDFKYQIDIPSGAVGAGVEERTIASSTNSHARIPRAAGSSLTVINVNTAWPMIITLKVGVDNGATAGNVALHWAQNTSDATNTTVRAGGYMLGMKQA